MSFDPYAAWLQIPENRRPPNHYELFGLPTLEPDVERIRAAAMDRISLVRKYQIGQHADDAIRLLGEMSRAFDCLTDTQRKLDYDRQLGGRATIVAEPTATVADAPTSQRPPPAPLPRAKLLEPTAAPSAAGVKPVVLKPVAATQPVAATPIATSPATLKTGDGLAAQRRRRAKQQNQTMAAAAAIVVAVAAGAVWLATRGDSPSVASSIKVANEPSAIPSTKPNGGDVSLSVDGPPLTTTPAVPASPATSTTVVPTPNAAEPTAAAPSAETAAVMPTPAQPPTVVPVTTIQPQPPQIANPPAVAANAPPSRGPKADLLKLIDANRDALKGSWLVDVKGNLHSPQNVSCAALELPVDPPEEYELSVNTVRFAPAVLVFGLVMQQSPFLVVVDGGGKVGLEMVDGRMFHSNETTHPGGVYPQGTRTDFVCTVFKSRATVSVNGQQIIDWQGDPSRLRLFQDWPIRNRKRLFIGSHDRHLIVKAELTPLNGTLTLPSTNPSPGTIVPAPSPPQSDGTLAARAQKLIDSLVVDKAAPTPQLAESMLFLMHEAVEAEEFDVAARLAAAVPQVDDEVRDLNLRRWLRVETSEAKKAQAICEALARAKQTLATDPDDGPANHIYGRHICLTVGDWSRGLPHLAKSSDAKLAALAANDLAAPTDAKAQVDLADRWWEQVLSATADHKPQFKARAGHWYIQALPGLTGLTKVQVEKRVAQIDVSPPTPVAAGAGDFVSKYRNQIRMAASTQYSSSWNVERLIDGKQNTSWFSAVNDSVGTGRSPWFTATFPSDITVTKVRVWGNREGSYAQQPYRVLTASVLLLNDRGMMIRSMNAAMQGPYGDLEFNFRVPTPGVRTIRFQSVTDQGSLNGSGEIALGELEVQ